VIGFLAIVFWPRGVKVTTPEAGGPAVVEEPAPSNADDKVAFDKRKAASACRVAIMQSLKDPSTAEFVDDLDNTPWVAEDGGDYNFKVAIKARNETGIVTRVIACRAHAEATGWSIAKLSEVGKP
jgi:hypothetical protein